MQTRRRSSSRLNDENHPNNQLVVPSVQKKSPKARRQTVDPTDLNDLLETLGDSSYLVPSIAKKDMKRRETVSTVDMDDLLNFSNPNGSDVSGFSLMMGDNTVNGLSVMQDSMLSSSIQPQDKRRETVSSLDMDDLLKFSPARSVGDDITNYSTLSPKKTAPPAASNKKTINKQDKRRETVSAFEMDDLLKFSPAPSVMDMSTKKVSPFETKETSKPNDKRRETISSTAMNDLLNFSLTDNQTNSSVLPANNFSMLSDLSTFTAQDPLHLEVEDDEASVQDQANRRQTVDPTMMTDLLNQLETSEVQESMLEATPVSTKSKKKKASGKKTGGKSPSSKKLRKSTTPKKLLETSAEEINVNDSICTVDLLSNVENLQHLIEEEHEQQALQSQSSQVGDLSTSYSVCATPESITTAPSVVHEDSSMMSMIPLEELLRRTAEDEEKEQQQQQQSSERKSKGSSGKKSKKSKRKSSSSSSEVEADVVSTSTLSSPIPEPAQSKPRVTDTPDLLSFSVLDQPAAQAGTNSTNTMVPSRHAFLLPPPSALKSCLSAKKAPRPTSSAVPTPGGGNRNVVFGSPEVAEFHKTSPITNFTPMDKAQAKRMFTLPVPEEEEVSAVVDEETLANERVLDEWDRLTNTSGVSSDDGVENDEDIRSLIQDEGPFSIYQEDAVASPCREESHQMSPIALDTQTLHGNGQRMSMNFSLSIEEEEDKTTNSRRRSSMSSGKRRKSMLQPLIPMDLLQSPHQLQSEFEEAMESVDNSRLSDHLFTSHDDDHVSGYSHEVAAEKQEEEGEVVERSTLSQNLSTVSMSAFELANEVQYNQVGNNDESEVDYDSMTHTVQLPNNLQELLAANDVSLPHRDDDLPPMGDDEFFAEPPQTPSEYEEAEAEAQAEEDEEQEHTIEHTVEMEVNLRALLDNIEGKHSFMSTEENDLDATHPEVNESSGLVEIPQPITAPSPATTSLHHMFPTANNNNDVSKMSHESSHHIFPPFSNTNVSTMSHASNASSNTLQDVLGLSDLTGGCEEQAESEASAILAPVTIQYNEEHASFNEESMRDAHNLTTITSATTNTGGCSMQAVLPEDDLSDHSHSHYSTNEVSTNNQSTFLEEEGQDHYESSQVAEDIQTVWSPVARTTAAPPRPSILSQSGNGRVSFAAPPGIPAFHPPMTATKPVPSFPAPSVTGTTTKSTGLMARLQALNTGARANTLAQCATPAVVPGTVRPSRRSSLGTSHGQNRLSLARTRQSLATGIVSMEHQENDDDQDNSSTSAAIPPPVDIASIITPVLIPLTVMGVPPPVVVPPAVAESSKVVEEVVKEVVVQPSQPEPQAVAPMTKQVELSVPKPTEAAPVIAVSDPRMTRLRHELSTFHHIIAQIHLMIGQYTATNPSLLTHVQRLAETSFQQIVTTRSSAGSMEIGKVEYRVLNAAWSHSSATLTSESVQRNQCATFVELVVGELKEGWLKSGGQDTTATATKRLDNLVDTDDWAQEWVDLLTEAIVHLVSKLQAQQPDYGMAHANENNKTVANQVAAAPVAAPPMDRFFGKVLNNVNPLSPPKRGAKATASTTTATPVSTLPSTLDSAVTSILEAINTANHTITANNTSTTYTNSSQAVLLMKTAARLSFFRLVSATANVIILDVYLSEEHTVKLTLTWTPSTSSIVSHKIALSSSNKSLPSSSSSSSHQTNNRNKDFVEVYYDQILCHRAHGLLYEAVCARKVPTLSDLPAYLLLLSGQIVSLRQCMVVVDHIESTLGGSIEYMSSQGQDLLLQITHQLSNHPAVLSLHQFLSYSLSQEEENQGALHFDSMVLMLKDMREFLKKA